MDKHPVLLSTAQVLHIMRIAAGFVHPDNPALTEEAKSLIHTCRAANAAYNEKQTINMRIVP